MRTIYARAVVNAIREREMTLEDGELIALPSGG
jgi:hypothetical protein